MNATAKLVCLVSCLCVLSLSAAWEEPTFSGWSGTAYRENGWFTYQMKEPYANGSLRFESGDPFVLSPVFAAPIRKVVLKVVSKSDAPTRFLQLWPLAGGVETTNAISLATSAAVKDETAVVSADFSSTENVTAFRLGLGSGSKGNWALEGLCVFFGEKASGEDAKLLEYAQQLPTPDNLRIADFTPTSLRLAVDPVTGAEGYRFEAFRLDGVPRTICREDFASAPALATGWSFGETNNVILDAATGTTYPDTKTADDGNVALQITKGKNEADTVRVEILSPLVGAALTEYSFVSKAASSGVTPFNNAVTVFGRATADDAWTPLADPVAVATSKAWITNAVPTDLNVRQVKFVFTADAATCRNCALDTLRLVYGGNETRTSVGAVDCAADTPAAEFAALDTARYAVRARALGGTVCRDSSWTEEKVVDLNWASVTVSAPENVRCEQNGAALLISWQPVTDAESYRIELVAVDDSEDAEPVVVTTSATSARLTLASIGQYAATVTAISPGGKSTAAALPLACTAVLSSPADVSAEAIEQTAISASWKAVPLAECYQVRLLRLDSDAVTETYGWPKDGDGCGLPDGWEHETYWAGDHWTSGSDVFPSLPYSGCWIASAAYDRPVTHLVCKYKCASTESATLEVTRFVVSVADGAGTWETVTNLPTAAALQTLTLDFAEARDVRRIRFAAQSDNTRELGKVALGALSVTVGTETRTVVRSVSVSDETVTFRDLDPTRSYRVSVLPQPSDDESLAVLSPTVDLAHEKFRATGALPISQFKGGVYAQDFACLTNVVGDLEARKLDLDYWQFFKGSGEAEKILYTSASNRTTGGVYVFADAARQTDAFALGTLATSSYGCAVGLALVNDSGIALSLRDLSFDWIQRTARTGANTNVCECLVTDGATALDTEGNWITLSTFVPQTADAFQPEANRQSVNVTDALPLALPAGRVLILRWRQVKGASGPMMAIDNVRLAFPDVTKGFFMMLR